jgi:hypothetical protein
MRRALPLYDTNGLPIGLAEWWEDERLVRLGRVRVPQLVMAVIAQRAMAPTVSLEIEVTGGLPRCKEIVLQAPAFGRGIVAADLKTLPISSWVESVLSAIAQEALPYKDGVLVRQVRDDRSRDLAGLAVRRAPAPRRLTPAFLRQVAAVYKRNLNANPVQAVAQRFGVSDGRASKWVHRARRDSYLPPTQPGKKLA